MTIYFVIILLLVFFVFHYDLQNQEFGKDFWYKSILLILICVAGLRYRVGSDTIVYMYEYDTEYVSIFNVKSINYFFENERRNPFWILINSVLKAFSSDFTLFQFLHAILINVVIFKFIKKYTQYIFSSILLYFIALYPQLNFEAMRQSIALSLFIIGYMSLEGKKGLLKYYLYIFFAVLFHESALCAIPIPFLKYIPLNKKSVWVIAMVIITSLFLSNLLKNQMVGLMVGYFGEKGEVYSEEAASAEASSGILTFIMPLVYIFMVWSIYKLNLKSRFFCIIILFEIFINTLSNFIPIFYRIKYYFFIFLLIGIIDFIIAFPLAYYNPKVLVRFFSFFGILFIVWFYSRIYFVIPNDKTVPAITKYAPYHTVFSKEVDIIRERNWAKY